MDKSDLIAQLEAIKINYISVFAVYIMFLDEKSYSFLQNKSVEFDDHRKLKVGIIAELMSNKTVNEKARKEFINMGLRSFIRESFEIIQDYCKNSHQMKKFNETKWFNFARLIRNCFSHNFKFILTESDVERLPIKWRNKEIKLDMKNTVLNLQFFGYLEAFDLFEDMYQFVIKELN